MDASYCLDGWNPPDPPPPLPEEEQRAFGAALRDAVLRRWPDYPWYEALDVLSVAAMYAQPYLEALMDGPWPATGMDGAVRRDLERALGCRLPAITGAADLAAAAKERAAARAAKPKAAPPAAKTLPGGKGSGRGIGGGRIRTEAPPQSSERPFLSPLAPRSRGGGTGVSENCAAPARKPIPRRAMAKAAKPRGRAAMAPKAPKPAARGTVPAKAPAGPAKPGRRTPGTAAEAPKAPVRNRSRKPPAAPPEDMTALSGALQAAGLTVKRAAGMVGVEPAALRRILSGREPAPPELRKKLGMLASVAARAGGKNRS